MKIAVDRIENVSVGKCLVVIVHAQAPDTETECFNNVSVEIALKNDPELTVSQIKAAALEKTKAILGNVISACQ